MILLTGGSGLLGSELKKHIDCYCPSRSELDIRYPNLTGLWYKPDTQLVVHCAGYTDVLKAETDKKACYETNVLGTRHIANLGIPMLYISTEYVFDGKEGNYDEEAIPNPQNFYSLTKLLGEYESRQTRSVVVRCLFKRRPFKHDAACIDQFTSGDYVERIAYELIKVIEKFDRCPPTIHIGTGKKSTFKLARETREVAKIRVDDVRGVRLPRDTSLNTSLWERIKNGN